MSIKTVADFRKASEKGSGEGTAKRYGKESREFAVRFARQALECGGTLERTAGELGVPVQTLSYWPKGAASAGPSLLPVKVRRDAAMESRGQAALS